MLGHHQYYSSMASFANNQDESLRGRTYCWGPGRSCPADHESLYHGQQAHVAANPHKTQSRAGWICWTCDAACITYFDVAAGSVRVGIELNKTSCQHSKRFSRISPTLMKLQTQCNFILEHAETAVCTVRGSIASHVRRMLCSQAPMSCSRH